MADLRPKRIAELIEPLRVTPGRRVTLAKHFDPGYKAGFLDKEEGTELLAHGVELLSEYQERLAAQDTHGVVVVLQALDAAGKDGTIRHVMSGVNPQGVSVHSYKAPSPWSSTTTTCGASPATCLAAARSASSTAPTTRRSSWCACTPRSSRTSNCPAGARAGRLEEALPRHQRLGAATSPTRLHRREAVPEPLEGGAAHPLPPAHRPARPQLEVLGRRRQGAQLLGRLPEGLLRDALGARAPSGRPGTSSPPTTSGSRASARRRSSRTR